MRISVNIDFKQFSIRIAAIYIFNFVQIPPITSFFVLTFFFLLIIGWEFYDGYDVVECIDCYTGHIILCLPASQN